MFSNQSFLRSPKKGKVAQRVAFPFFGGGIAINLVAKALA
jgi:hypothetical protein